MFLNNLQISGFISTESQYFYTLSCAWKWVNYRILFWNQPKFPIQVLIFDS